MPSLRDRLGALRRDPRERIRLWRMHYFVDVCRLLQVTAILRMRCGDGMAPAKRRALDRFERADRSALPLTRLGARGARELVARRPQTLGAEWMLVHALRVAAGAGGDRARRPAAARAAGRRPAARARSPPGRRDAGRAGGARDRRQGRAAAARGPRRRAGARQPADPVDRPAPLLRRLHREAQPRAAARRARPAGAGGDGRPRRLAARRLAGADRGLQRARRRLRPRRGGLRARVARPRGQPRRPLHRDDVVDRPRRGRRAPRARRRAVPVPDPGVRAVHVPDGDLRGARRRLLPAPPHRAVLDGAPARLVPAPGPRRVRERRRRRPRSRTRSRRSTRRAPASWPPARRAAAAVLRAPGAPCGAQHVRARRARARPRRRGRRARRLDARRHRDGRGAPAAGARRRRVARAAPARRPGRLRAHCCASTTSASR